MAVVRVVAVRVVCAMAVVKAAVRVAAVRVVMQMMAAVLPLAFVVCTCSHVNRCCDVGCDPLQLYGFIAFESITCI